MLWPESHRPQTDTETTRPTRRHLHPHLLCAHKETPLSLGSRTHRLDFNLFSPLPSIWPAHLYAHIYMPPFPSLLVHFSKSKLLLTSPFFFFFLSTSSHLRTQGPSSSPHCDTQISSRPTQKGSHGGSEPRVAGLRVLAQTTSRNLGGAYRGKHKWLEERRACTWSPAWAPPAPPLPWLRAPSSSHPLSSTEFRKNSSLLSSSS